MKIIKIKAKIIPKKPVFAIIPILDKFMIDKSPEVCVDASFF